MNIDDFKKQFPQYKDWDDIELGRALHEKYYPDMEWGEFSGQFLQREAPPEAKHPTLYALKETAKNIPINAMVTLADVLKGVSAGAIDFGQEAVRKGMEEEGIPAVDKPLYDPETKISYTPEGMMVDRPGAVARIASELTRPSTMAKTTGAFIPVGLATKAASYGLKGTLEGSRVLKGLAEGGLAGSLYGAYEGAAKGKSPAEIYKEMLKEGGIWAALGGVTGKAAKLIAKLRSGKALTEAEKATLRDMQILKMEEGAERIAKTKALPPATPRLSEEVKKFIETKTLPPAGEPHPGYVPGKEPDWILKTKTTREPMLRTAAEFKGPKKVEYVGKAPEGAVGVTEEPRFAIKLKNGKIIAPKEAKSHPQMYEELGLEAEDIAKSGFVYNGQFGQIRQGIFTPEAPDLAGKVASGEGFSWRPDQATPETGYMVSLAGRGIAISPKSADSPQVKRWLENAQKEIAQNPDEYIGGWLDESTGKYYLDISKHSDNLHEAITTGAANKQKAVWDLAQNKEVAVQPFEKMPLEHYGPEGLKEIRGARVPEETRPYSREIRQRMEAMKAEGEEYVPEAPFYKAGEKPEAIVAAGKTKYTYRAKKGDLYDLGQDPNGLIGEAQKAGEGDPSLSRGLLSKMVKENGFKGMISKDGTQAYIFTDEAPVTLGGEGGFVTMPIVRDLAATGVGAGIGAYSDKKHPLRGAVIGGSTGFLISRGLLNKIIKPGTKLPKGTKAIGKDWVEIPPNMPNRLKETAMARGPQKEFAKGVTASMVEKGTERNKGLFIMQMAEEVAENPEKFRQIANAYGISPTEFMNSLGYDIRTAAKKLHLMSYLSKQLKKSADPEMARLARQVDFTPWDHFQVWWRQADAVRRGLLVTQLSTAVRNAMTQFARVGMDVPGTIMDNWVARIFGKTPQVKATAGLEQFLRLFQKNKKVVNRILQNSPKDYNRMFGVYMSDIQPGMMGRGAKEAVNILNTGNRFQEFLTRRAVFLGQLDRALWKRGVDLNKIVKNGDFGQITKEEIKQAVQKSLEYTFAKQPAWGSVGQAFITAVNKLPGATFLIPFPRFMVNAIKFNYEYSPLALIKLASKSQRAAIRAGNMETLAKIGVGSSMLIAAYQLRQSKYAGEKWYQIKLPSGKILDTRAYNPLAAYMFVADVVAKMERGELYRMTISDIAQGLIGSNIRAGAGLYAVDKILSGFTELSRENWKRPIAEMGGQVAAGFLTPLNQVKELIGGFNEFTVKETRSDPFWGPIKSKIPGVEKSLPPLYTGTRGEPAKYESPATRQLSGFAITPKKNKLEQELDRLGFTRQEFLPSTGDPKADNIMRQKMGILSEKAVVPLLNTKLYNKLSNKGKAFFITQVLKDVRSGAREWAEASDPKLFQKVKMQRIPMRTKMFLREKGAIP